MFVVITISIISFILACLSSRKDAKSDQCLKIAFVLLTSIQCIQYHYGTDYEGYYFNYLHDYNGNVINLIKQGYFKEPLWAFLNWALPKPYGFFVLVSFFALIQNRIYYIFIKNNVEVRYRWLAMFIYIFTTSYYLLNFSMLRQGFAIALVIFAGLKACEDKRVMAFTLVIIAALIHNSAIIFLPALLFAFYEVKYMRILVLLYVAFAYALFLSKDLIETGFLVFAEDDNQLSQYSLYASRIEAVDTGLGMGFILNSLVYIIMLWCLLRHSDQLTKSQKFFLMAASVSICFTPLQLTISGIAGRLGYYFSAFQIAAVPIAYSMLKPKKLRLMAMFILVFMTFNSYRNFYNSEDAKLSYVKPYRTIFSVLL